MAVQISWGSPEKTFTVFEFAGRWTWEEYYAARTQGIEMVQSVTHGHPVNIVVDISEGSVFPTNMLSHFGSSIDHSPVSFDLCVIVTRSRFIEALASILSKLKLATKFKVVKTRDEALTVFAEYDKAKAQGKPPTQSRARAK